MMVMNLEKIDRILQQECWLKKSSPIILALSGGPDSLCLYDVMTHLGYDLIAAHLDHMIRPESQSEVAAVKKMVSERGGKGIFGREDAPAFAASNGMSIEEAARHLRYRFLFAQAEAHQAQAVAVAQHADDQVETILMHFLRGTGLAGLSGMHFRQAPTEWHPVIPLVRPLLDTWQDEIDAYIDARQLDAIIDQSNYETVYFRNRIRHQLIPMLEREYNPQMRKAIWRLSKTLKDDALLIHELVEGDWSKYSRVVGECEVHLDAAALKASQPGLKRNLIRRGLAHFSSPTSEFGYDDIDKVMDLLDKPTGREMQLANHLRAIVTGGELIFFKENKALWLFDYPQIHSGVEIISEGEYKLGENWVIHITQSNLTAPGVFEPSPDLMQVVLDADCLEFPLLVRTSLPGERFKPFGMQGHSVKLSDFFVNEKLPRRVRQKYPLVVSGRNIIWVPGFRIADGYQVNSDTTRVVCIKLHQP